MTVVACVLFRARKLVSPDEAANLVKIAVIEAGVAECICVGSARGDYSKIYVVALPCVLGQLRIRD